jgi:hypothetical protein
VHADSSEEYYVMQTIDYQKMVSKSGPVTRYLEHHMLRCAGSLHVNSSRTFIVLGKGARPR